MLVATFEVNSTVAYTRSPMWLILTSRMDPHCSKVLAVRREPCSLFNAHIPKHSAQGFVGSFLHETADQYRTVLAITEEQSI